MLLVVCVSEVEGQIFGAAERSTSNICHESAIHKARDLPWVSYRPPMSEPLLTARFSEALVAAAQLHAGQLRKWHRRSLRVASARGGRDRAGAWAPRKTRQSRPSFTTPSRMLLRHSA